jgi:anti-sigma regulatory factor (Ser/Thr protein kinase)
MTSAMTRVALLPLRQWLAHGLVTAACCAAIAVWRTQANGRPWDVEFVYALAIGMTAWLVIDVGRYAWRASDAIPWPAGWRGGVLVLAGVLAAFAVGITVGDAYSGRDSWRAMLAAPASPLGILALTSVVSVVGTLVFYHRGRARAMEQQMLHARKDAAEARLRLLESQLDPHMLFNTLATLRALIPADPARAVDVLDRMGDFLRSTLQGSRATHHTLRNEFDRLEDYLALMQVRMGKRLAYRLKLPQSLASTTVPALLLQPLVENAVKHGVEPKVSGGTVIVTAAAEMGMLTLSVSDDGIGVEQVGPLGMEDASQASLDRGRSGSGFGMTHVIERLAAAYGAQASLEITAATGGGTHSIVRLPILKDE